MAVLIDIAAAAVIMAVPTNDIFYYIDFFMIFIITP
jgi:hypothetical protein